MNAKERKRTLKGILHDALNTCLSKGRRTITNNITKLTCKACLVVNHPEIALTLEKCLIQGKIIVFFR